MTTEETLNVKLSSDLLEKLRKKSMEKFGHKRGYLKKATTEAITKWINEN